MLIDDSELMFGEVEYETRFVAFFDLLGWKASIDEAGDDPRRIARLAFQVRQFASFVGLHSDEGVRMTTFSDNVVVSKPFASGDIGWLLQGLAVNQLGAAMMGFWLRGGVTVGQIYHDEHIVFGPALNRAYELESRFANVPRFLIDPEIRSQLPTDTDYIALEEDAFLDPFAPHFFDRVHGNTPISVEVLDKVEELSGFVVDTTPTKLSGHLALSMVFSRIVEELKRAPDQRCWEKFAWVMDRLGPRLGYAAKATDIPKAFTV